MNRMTIDALAAFPAQLEAHYAAFPAGFEHWSPERWDGIPSEHFTAIEQVWHVRDIEVEGYRVRFERTLRESTPFLGSIDSETLAVERAYARRDAAEALAAFREARIGTVAMLSGLSAAQLARGAVFEGYGATTLRGLAHFLCSHDQQHLAGLQWLLGKIDAVRSTGDREA